LIQARKSFFEGDKFKIYARLFAEIVKQILETQQGLLLQEIDLIGKVFFKELKPNIHPFELRYSILKFTTDYINKKQPNRFNQIFEILMDELIIMESINDPYNIISKI
jgi:hypothetical protein